MLNPAKVKTYVRQKKKMGRPVTVKADSPIGIRLPSRQLDIIDAWAAARGVSRSEAIRRLVDRGLAAETVATSAVEPARASKPAAGTKTAPRKKARPRRS